MPSLIQIPLSLISIDSILFVQISIYYRLIDPSSQGSPINKWSSYEQVWVIDW